MSGSLYGFVKGREPVSPEVVATDLLALPDLNGDARKQVERLVGKDSRFVWDSEGLLRTADLADLDLASASYVVFDIETTGGSAGQDGAITELGAVKIIDGVVADEFSTFVNPERPIAPFVVRLTGITDRMVAGAPTIGEVMPGFEEFAEGSVLVAHNASFDCSFVEAAREGDSLPNPVLDTLKLARILVPGLRRYRLSSLVTHFGVRQAPNHRALADAAATASVFLKLLKMLRSAGVGSVGEALMLRGRGKVKPQKQHLAENVPNAPGVYYFVDKHGTALYVGKAKDLRARVRTYFNGGDGRRKIKRLVEEVAEVRVRQTPDELQALILESREIKRLLPRYNSVGRGDETTWYIRLDHNEAYPVPERVSDSEPEERVTYLGPYRSAGVLDTCIEALGRIFPLKRCSGEEGVCFYGQIGRCAPCLGMSEEKYREVVIGEIIALLRGEGGEEYLAELIKERGRLAAELEFEAAARLRDLISGIERIRLARAVVNAEGLQAVVATSPEPDMVEVFVLSGGSLIAHRGFEAGDKSGLSGFAAEVLTGQEDLEYLNPENTDETRIVAAYLKRRAAAVEAVRLESAEGLLEAVERLRED